MKVDEFLEMILPRGASLEDHLFATWLAPGSDTESQDIGMERLRRWNEVLTQFDPQGFERRLYLEGIPWRGAVLAEKLRPPILRNQPPKVGWARQVWWLAGRLRLSSNDRVGLAAEEPIPFEELFFGIASEEMDQLRQRCPYLSKLLSPQAQASLALELVRCLSWNLAPALEHEFSLYRVRSNQAGKTRSQIHSRRLYDSFLDRLRQGDAAALLVKYAASARRCVTTIAQWRRNQIELVRRLAADRERIATFQGCDCKSVFVEAISPTLSDRHDDGRSVVRLEFSGGRALFYKPRSTALEAAVATLAKEISGKTREFLPDVLEGDGYGWVREMSGGSPDLTDYYRSAGHLVGLAWVLAATDLHDENIIMGAKGPIVVDGEMFASPLPQAFGGSSLHAIRAVENHTVLRSGLLPKWVSYDDGNLIQVNGLAGGRHFVTGLKAYEWRDVNSDTMALRVRELSVDAANIDNTNHHNPEKYVKFVSQGFQEFCERLRSEKNSKTTARIRDLLTGKPVRFLVRDTTAYAILLERLRQARFSLTLVDAEIEMEGLAATLVADDAPKELWSFYRHEKQALNRGDIPKFVTTSDTRCWSDNQGRELQIFSRSGLEMIEENLGALSRGEMVFQESLIRAAFQVAGDPLGREINQSGIFHGKVVSRHGSILTALNIGKTLLACSVRSEDEYVNWIAPQRHGVTNHMNLSALGTALYDGRSGIGLFLAALATITGDQDIIEGVQAVFKPLLDKNFGLHWSEDLDNVRGGCVGRASVIYALHTVGSLLNDDTFIEAADRLTSAIRLSDFQSNKCADWVSGLAGEAMVLEQIRVKVPEGWEAAVLNRLQELCEERRDGEIIWPQISSPFGDIGAAHGAVGIAYSLEHCFPQSAEAGRLRKGANKSVVSRWKIELDKSPKGWAHGVAGILSMGDAILPKVHTDQARAKLRNEALYQFDTLANGNCALIDYFIDKGDYVRASRLTNAMLARAVKQGGFSIPGGEFLAPGLFDGLSGIGYTLLRVAEPRRLPSVLRLELTHAGL